MQRNETDRQEIMDGLKACYASIADLGAQMTEEQWQTQSLCPEWDMTGVFLHLTALEAALLDLGESHPSDWTDLGGMGLYSEEWAELSGPELFDQYCSTVAKRVSQLEAMSDEIWNAESWSPIGIGPYGRFMAVRVFDFWIHEQDMRVPLGMPGHLEGPAAEISLAQFRSAAGFVMGKGAGLADGESVALRVTGGLEDEILVVADGRASVVDSLEAPTTELVIDHQALMLLGAGRVDPQEIIEADRVRITGDVELGDRVARNLRFITF